MRALKANADAINLAGGYAGGSIAAAKLVTEEQDLSYKSTPVMKQESIMQDAAKRYLVALTFTGLNSKRHRSLKADIHPLQRL